MKTSKKKGKGKMDRRYVEIPDGKGGTLCRVRYTVCPRKGDYNLFVKFRDKTNRRLEKSTKTHDWQKADEEARRIIGEEYATSPLTLAAIEWDAAIALLEARLVALGRGTGTIGTYRSVLATLRKALPGIFTPMQVSLSLAEAYRDQRAGKKKASTVNTNLTTLAVIWGYWLEMKKADGSGVQVVGFNPWTKMKRAKAVKKVKRYLTPAEVLNFGNWLKEYFQGWETPALWWIVKNILACRSMDLTSLPSSCLRDGCLVIPASLRKEKKEQRYPLEPGLYAKLKSIAGKDYLWEDFQAGRQEYYQKSPKKAYYGAQRGRKGALGDTFGAENTVRFMMRTLKEYLTLHPEVEKFTLHASRGSAISNLYLAGFTPEQACEYASVSLPVAMRHYSDFRKASTMGDGVSELSRQFGFGG